MPTKNVVTELVNQGLTNFASEHSLVTKADLNERVGALPNQEVIRGLCEHSIDTFATNHGLLKRLDLDAILQRIYML